MSSRKIDFNNIALNLNSISQVTARLSSRIDTLFALISVLTLVGQMSGEKPNEETWKIGVEPNYAPESCNNQSRRKFKHVCIFRERVVSTSNEVYYVNRFDNFSTMWK